MLIALNVLLFAAAVFCLAVGITAMATSWVFPWLAGKVLRPRLWGAGYALFGVVTLYHAVVALMHVDPAVSMVLTAVTTATALGGLGMMVLAQRVGQGAPPSLPTGSGTPK